MKTIIQVVLWIACIGLGYLIYQSINAPIIFQNIKEERYAKVISVLKDIGRSQEAYKTVNGKFANDFKTLVNFVENGNYIITQQRDSSFIRFDELYKIDAQVDTIVVDTLGLVSVKDSLFKKDNRYKSMMNVPGAANGEKFEMKAATVNKGGFNAAVFEAKAKKNLVLYDQPKDLVAIENAHISVEQVKGSEIKIGSLNEVSTNGNWPPIYDKREDNR